MDIDPQQYINALEDRYKQLSLNLVVMEARYMTALNALTELTNKNKDLEQKIAELENIETEQSEDNGADQQSD